MESSAAKATRCMHAIGALDRRLTLTLSLKKRGRKGREGWRHQCQSSVDVGGDESSHERSMAVLVPVGGGHAMPQKQDNAIGMPVGRRHVQSRTSTFIGVARSGDRCGGLPETAVGLWEQRAALASLKQKREGLGVAGAHSGVHAPAKRRCRGLGHAVRARVRPRSGGRRPDTRPESRGRAHEPGGPWHAAGRARDTWQHPARPPQTGPAPAASRHGRSGTTGCREPCGSPPLSARAPALRLLPPSPRARRDAVPAPPGSSSSVSVKCQLSQPSPCLPRSANAPSAPDAPAHPALGADPCLASTACSPLGAHANAERLCGWSSPGIASSRRKLQEPSCPAEGPAAPWLPTVDCCELRSVRPSNRAAGAMAGRMLAQSVLTDAWTSLHTESRMQASTPAGTHIHSRCMDESNGDSGAEPAEAASTCSSKIVVSSSHTKLPNRLSSAASLPIDAVPTPPADSRAGSAPGIRAPLALGRSAGGSGSAARPSCRTRRLEAHSVSAAAARARATAASPPAAHEACPSAGWTRTAHTTSSAAALGAIEASQPTELAPTAASDATAERCDAAAVGWLDAFVVWLDAFAEAAETTGANAEATVCTPDVGGASECPAGKREAGCTASGRRPHLSFILRAPAALLGSLSARLASLPPPPGCDPPRSATRPPHPTPKLPEGPVCTPFPLFASTSASCPSSSRARSETPRTSMRRRLTVPVPASSATNAALHVTSAGLDTNSRMSAVSATRCRVPSPAALHPALGAQQLEPVAAAEVVGIPPKVTTASWTSSTMLDRISAAILSK
eukprot:scaffold3131_cov112-Isochrysis_galbana.AAC.2